MRTNRRLRVKTLVAKYDAFNARWTTISREAIAKAKRRGSDGLPAGAYRERDRLMPILLRHTKEERDAVADSTGALRVLPRVGERAVPLNQVTESIAVEWEDPVIGRWARRRAISRFEAMGTAAPSRLRPVVLAAGTTVLGVVPLLPDVFWKSMAVTIMFGLAFGTLLMMILVPVIHATLFRLKPED